MGEFDIIGKYFANISSQPASVVIGPGDDAACIALDATEDLLTSTDTEVAGVHFFADDDPFDIACKAVLVNVSDIVAMGGEARYLLLALTIPDATDAWLERFAAGLVYITQKYNLALVGGDLTRGPLVINVTVLGAIAKGCAIRRNGATMGDALMLSGVTGLAALSLERASIADPADRKILHNAMYQPEVRQDLSLILRTCATAAIDISDGLIADLGHMVKNQGAVISTVTLPIHPLLTKYRPGRELDYILYGGGDYVLLFAVPDKHVKVLIEQYSCYHIGNIASNGSIMLETAGRVTSVVVQGYDHFRSVDD